MDLTDYVELLQTVPTTQLLMVLSFIMFLYFTMYGVFGDDPPIFKKKSLDDSARRLSRLYGMGALVVFLLSLLLPVLYQFLFPSIDFYVGGTKVDLDDNDIRVVLIDQNGTVLDDTFEVSIARWHDSVSLPNKKDEFGVYQGDLELRGYYDGREQRIDDSSSVGPLQISARHGKVFGPLTLVDQVGKAIYQLPINDAAQVIVPDRGRVEIINTRIHYHKADEPTFIYIGSELDLEQYTTGRHDEFFRDNLHSTPETCQHISDKYRGRTTSSGMAYDPSELVAASSYYPVGTIIEVSVPYVNTEPVVVDIVDHNPRSKCALSTSVFDQLDRTPGSIKAMVRVIDYKHKRERELNDDPSARPGK